MRETVLAEPRDGLVSDADPDEGADVAENKGAIGWSCDLSD